MFTFKDWKSRFRYLSFRRPFLVLKLFFILEYSISAKQEFFIIYWRSVKFGMIDRCFQYILSVV